MHHHPTRRAVVIAGAAAALAPALPAHATPMNATAPDTSTAAGHLPVQPYASYWYPDSLPAGSPGEGITWRSLKSWRAARRPRPGVQRGVRPAGAALHTHPGEHHGPRGAGPHPVAGLLRAHRLQPVAGLTHRRLLRPHPLGLPGRAGLLGRLVRRGPDPRAERAGRGRRPPARRARARHRLPAAGRLRRSAPVDPRPRAQGRRGPLPAGRTARRGRRRVRLRRVVHQRRDRRRQHGARPGHARFRGRAEEARRRQGAARHLVRLDDRERLRELAGRAQRARTRRSSGPPTPCSSTSAGRPPPWRRPAPKAEQLGRDRYELWAGVDVESNG